VKYDRRKRQKKRQQETQQDKKENKNRTEEFHALFQAIVPVIMDIMLTDRCIDRNSPVFGGRMVAEYDSLTKKRTQLYTMKEMVQPEEKLKIYDEPLSA
jgi:hypothetical protein